MRVEKLRIQKTRSILTVGTDVTTKTYRRPEDALQEINWYDRVPWACPRLIDADIARGVLIIATHPVAQSLPHYRPVEQLAELLRALETHGIHHMDVHPGNIVAGPDGPLLIDWETACEAAVPSYDLYGPDASGAPIPDIHAALSSGYCMWWGSGHRMSIRNQWGADVPTRPKGCTDAPLPCSSPQ